MPRLVPKSPPPESSPTRCRRRAACEALPRLFTVPEVADRFGVSERKVWTMIALGELRAVRFGRRTTRIEASEVVRVLDSDRGTAA